MNVKYKNNSFRLADRKKSFTNALQGLKFLFKTQVNAKIEFLAAALIVIIAIILKISLPEWLFIAASIFVVFICEALNTIVELLADKITKAYDIEIKRIKDVASALVLLSVMLSLVVGGIIFIPKIF